ncbi:60S ribosomal subunit assembly/export protein loc-1 [Fusarium oxysporum f. sp. cubense race 1]|uniref:60S ribosomal subunit assembly/export protein loc-1 n=1 Tax=Fusarium oxysporum f. sp. cubense (strain race 1) TaxID=1229664 RepID=N4U6M4_FUSC1|nr:60S ribosomal subunit assembly/export protein loc-1 [Fusarium oxysporum f. sp. cubense race 1]
MGVTRTKTIKNKHAAAPGAAKTSKRSATDGIAKSKKPKGPTLSKQVKDKGREALLQKFKNPKKKKYTDQQLGIPELNKVTPVGVIKPRGKKKGKVFADDQESMSTIMALVQAEKDGQIESKMIKQRQMEEIREARKAEAEKKEQEKQSKLEDTKDSLRKRRKRKSTGDAEDNIKEFTTSGSKGTKSKGKKRVSFA